MSSSHALWWIDDRAKLSRFTARCSLKQGLPRDALELATQTIRLGGDWNSHLLLKGLAQIDLHEADGGKHERKKRGRGEAAEEKEGLTERKKTVVELIQMIVLSDRQMDDIELGVVLEVRLFGPKEKKSILLSCVPRN